MLAGLNHESENLQMDGFDEWHHESDTEFLSRDRRNLNELYSTGDSKICR